MQLNSAIATFKGGNSEKIGQVQVIPAGAPDESEMTRWAPTVEMNTNKKEDSEQKIYMCEATCI